MKRALLLGALALPLTTGCVCFPKKIPVTQAPAGSIPVEEARATVTRALLNDQEVYKNNSGSWAVHTPTKVIVRHTWIDMMFPAPLGTVRVALEGSIAEFKYDYLDGADLWLRATKVSKGAPEPILQHLHFKNPESATPFVLAFNELSARARTDPEAKDFEAKAAAWRAANPKPALSEEGNKQRILAENATRENDPARALEHFELALETDPTWPAGNLNAALILAGMEEYGSAVRYLKRFLLLEPDGRDSAAAREKLVIWEDKASRASP